MTTLPPWVKGPFKLILHVEGHLFNRNDFNRRIVLFNLDNSIEVSISIQSSNNGDVL